MLKCSGFRSSHTLVQTVNIKELDCTILVLIFCHISAHFMLLCTPFTRLLDDERNCGSLICDWSLNFYHLKKCQ